MSQRVSSSKTAGTHYIERADGGPDSVTPLQRLQRSYFASGEPSDSEYIRLAP